MQYLSSSQPSTVQQFLRFKLQSDTIALLPVSQLVAVLTIDGTQITAIPHLPSWVMGVYNWRGEVLWIVDMDHLIGNIPYHQYTLQAARYNILLLEHTLTVTGEQRRLGLMVQQVDGMEVLPLDDIQSIPNVSEEMVPFLKGYWLDAAGHMLTLFDGLAILDRMPVQ